MARVICVTSGKGGAGKTTVTANLGTALACLGQKVCVIDADYGLRNLDIPLGLSSRLNYDISDFMAGRCGLHQVIIPDKRLSNLSFVSCTASADHHEDPGLFRDVVHYIAQNYDYVLIDSPAGIENGFRNASYAADEAIIVTTPNRTALQDADRVIGLLGDLIDSPPQLIVNMSDDPAERDLNLENIVNILNIGLIGVIRMDVDIIRSVARGIPIALDPEQESGRRFRQIAQNLVTNEQETIFSDKPQKKRKRLFSFSKGLRWGQSNSV
ncbi:septum site-determining protein MinD [Paenibacillus sp. VCA1]|uniref:septum site-determining protein MinD n=1 Tax=Paenibacillus sp. VCA1 TaxID=3039148 RepID=UPI002870BEF1|nr:septum site-determining protein MinD [Paenibacillus sp. VCA1]MDR9855816.1 septum site-determining protein MinD [Paenibacillus sp. VCA1]